VCRPKNNVFQEIRNETDAFAARFDGKQDSAVVALLSHGEDGEVGSGKFFHFKIQIFGIDGKTVEISELTEKLNGEKCRALRDKPKMFFIQACRGG
jgi:hypothetical protein